MQDGLVFLQTLIGHQENMPRLNMSPSLLQGMLLGGQRLSAIIG